MPPVAPTSAPAGTASGGVAQTTGVYNPSTDFKGAPAGSYEAELYNKSQDTTGGTSTATPSSSPSLIVTSGASRSQYSQNVNTINQANANMSSANQTTGSTNTGVYNFIDKDGKMQQVSAANPNQAIKTATNIAPDSGVQDATKATPSVTPTPTTGGTTTAPAGGTAGTSGAGATGTSTLNGSGTSADGTSGDGTSTGTGVADQAYSDSIDGINGEISQAQDTMNRAAATLTNDPAAQNAVNVITSKFNQQAELMARKNNVLLGKARVSAAQGGEMQYAPDMYSSFMSDEQTQATQRINDILDAENQAVLKATQAVQSNDIKGLNDATKNYEKAQSDKIDAINKLSTATNTALKTAQAQQRLDMSQKQNQVNNDVKVSTALASTVAEQIKQSGMTDPDQISQYIQGMATKAGISNADILTSAVTKAQQASDKADLAAQNTKDNIANRDTRTQIASQKKSGTAKGTPKGGTDDAFDYSADDVAKLNNLLNQGTTDGKFAGRGKDGYVDPGAYTHAYTAWISAGGTPKGFLKVAPLTNVNPSSYTALPAALQPKAKASGNGAV